MSSFDKKIGEKIKSLREHAKMSQHVFSKRLGVSRPTLSQIESGERKLTPDELRKISNEFNISVDILLDVEKEPIILLEKQDSYKDMQKMKKSSIRISIPQKDLEKFKEVLLYILNKVGSKPNVGETVIYKLLFFIDFDYYELYEEQLIGATYIKNNYGPTPVEFKKIVEEMIKKEEIIRVDSKYFDYPQTKYLPLKQANIAILNGKEIIVIDNVLNRLSDMSAKKISDYSHGDVPWQVTEEGKQINYETVFYRTDKYSVREYE